MQDLMKKLTLITAVLAAAISIFFGGKLFETNEAGWMQVKQAAVTGDMSVRSDPGMYWQGFSDIFDYKVSDIYDFNNEQIAVRFSDAATANISGQIKFLLPTSHDRLLRIHRDFRSYEAVKNDLIRQVVAASLKQSATHFGAEEVYSTRRSDFIDLINDQIKTGLYATTFIEEVVKDDTTGTNKMKRKVRIKYDTNGQPVINEVSAFNTYGIEVIQLVIQEIDFDDQTDALIAQRKKAEQEEIVARAEAKKAQQDAIKAEEQGKAKVAEAKYKALVEKETAVVNAEREKEVAEQNALKAIEEKKAIVAKGEAESEANRLKVAAGLTPQERAQFEKETAIGVAEALSKVEFPNTLVIGGDKGGNGLNPFDAVGLESFMRISKNVADSVKK